MLVFLQNLDFRHSSPRFGRKIIASNTLDIDNGSQQQLDEFGRIFRHRVRCKRHLSSGFLCELVKEKFQTPEFDDNSEANRNTRA
jgi:hypothetical protein